MQEIEIHPNTLCFSFMNFYFGVYNMKLSLTPTLKCSWHVPHCTDPELKHRRGVTSRVFRWWVQASRASKPLVHSLKPAVFPKTFLFEVSWLLYKMFSLLSWVGSRDLTLESKKQLFWFLKERDNGAHKQWKIDFLILCILSRSTHQST